MKTKYWIFILGAVFVLCLGLSILLMVPTGAAGAVEVRSHGKLLYTLPLDVDTQVTVDSGEGVNVITVKDGKVAVTRADCPDGYCMKRGWCAGGVQIVCLPNDLVIRFTGQQTVDGVVG